MIICEKRNPDNIYERFYIDDDGDTLIFKIEIKDKTKDANSFESSTYMLKYGFKEIKGMFLREFKSRGYNTELLEQSFKL